MIQAIDGEVYNIKFDNLDEVADYAVQFFSDPTHDNDIIFADGYWNELIFISSSDIHNRLIDDNNYIRFSIQMFKDARCNQHIIAGGVVPVLNEFNEPVLLLKPNNKKGYVHQYDRINGEIDTRVFDLYDAVVLTDITEHAFILLRDALARYQGRIICAGKYWSEIIRLVPDHDRIELIEDEKNLPSDLAEIKTMYLSEFFSIMAGHQERCRNGRFSYDEIMTLVYFFATKNSYGDQNPEKNFYLVDPMLPIEGLMSICDKCQLPYAYAMANGYIPVLHLTQSDQSIYSDHAGDDIWSKFFDQPYGPIADEWHYSRNVYQFPMACITFSDRWLMKRISVCKEINLMNLSYLNERIRAEIDSVRKNVLTTPEKTIGVLIRGTDYTISHLPGHTIMASPEEIMSKIAEMESSGKYSFIYLATEDTDILEKMKLLCGNRLLYIDQRRFRIRPGELLADQNRDRKNDGLLRGTEYLTSLKLLSECNAFIASGACCGTTCALNSGKDSYTETYVFNKGHY